MDEQEQKWTQELLQHLSGYGFEGDEILWQVEDQIVNRHPLIYLEYRKSFGRHHVFYNLTVEDEEGSDNRYRLKEVRATLRKPVTIKPGLFAAINVGELDKRMASVDWYCFYNMPAKFEGPYPVVREILGDLRQLARDPQGRSAMRLLQFKYFPKDNLEEITQGELRKLVDRYEYSDTYKIEHWPHFSPDVAYLDMSGVLPELKQQLNYITGNTLNNLAALLCQNLSKSPEGFEIVGTLNTPEGYIEYSIPVKSSEGKYLVQPYSVVLRSYPEIEHGNFNGIDPRELEQLMYQIDWTDDDELFLPAKEHAPFFTSAVENIQHMHYRLSEDLVGCQYADLLALKFFQKVSFFEDQISDQAWDLLDSLPKTENRFPVDIALRKTISLLLGRAVQYEMRKGSGLGSTDWIRLDPSHKDRESYPFIVCAGPNRKEVEDMLDMLLVEASHHKGYQQRLLDGERVTLENRLGNAFQVAVDPERKTLLVFTMDGREVPFNFKMDPDYLLVQPPAVSRRVSSKTTTHIPTKRRSKRNKGKGP